MAICWERAVPLAFHLCCFYFSAVLTVCVPFPFGQDVRFDCIGSWSLPFIYFGHFSLNLGKTKNIRIFNGCEVLIENSVTTVRHHETCRVMPNSYPSDGIFNLHRRTIMDSFSCMLFLRQLRLDLYTCCLFQFYAKITTFCDQEMFGTAPLLYFDVETFGGNWR